MAFNWADWGFVGLCGIEPSRIRVPKPLSPKPEALNSNPYTLNPYQWPILPALELRTMLKMNAVSLALHRRKGFRVSGPIRRGLGCRVWDVGIRDLGFRVQGLGSRVQGLGFRV